MHDLITIGSALLLGFSLRGLVHHWSCPLANPFKWNCPECPARITSSDADVLELLASQHLTAMHRAQA